jgi:hypothetical protein
MKKHILPTLLAASALALASQASAATIASYDFSLTGSVNGTSDANDASAITGISLVTAFSDTGIGHKGTAGNRGYVATFPTGDDNTGVSASADNYFIRNSASDGVTLEQAINGGNLVVATGGPTNAGGDYSGFSITVDSGYVLNLESLTFVTSRSGTAPASISLLTSVNGFASAAASEQNFSFATGGTQTVTSIAGTAFDTLAAGTYEFRFYTYGAAFGTGAQNDPSRIDTIILTGDVSAIPEPSTYAALVGALALGFVAMKRRRSS